MSKIRYQRGTTRYAQNLRPRPEVIFETQELRSPPSNRTYLGTDAKTDEVRARLAVSAFN